MLENSFWRKGIIFCFRMSQYMLESMFPSMNRSSPVPAVVMQPQTMMLPPPCLTVEKAVFLVLLSRASPHMLDTIWVKQVYLRLIRPQDMVPVIHALGQVVFSKLFAGFFVSQLQKRLPSGTTAMQTDLLQCVIWALTCWPFTSATSKAMLVALMILFFEASFCNWCTAQGLNVFDRPLQGLFRVKPVLKNLCMTPATVL